MIPSHLVCFFGLCVSFGRRESSTELWCVSISQTLVCFEKKAFVSDQ